MFFNSVILLLAEPTLLHKQLRSFSPSYFQKIKTPTLQAANLELTDAVCHHNTSCSSLGSIANTI